MQSVNYDELVDIGYNIHRISENMYYDIDNDISKVKSALENRGLISATATKQASDQLMEIKKASGKLHALSVKYSDFISKTVPQSYRQAEMEAGGKLATMTTLPTNLEEYTKILESGMGVKEYYDSKKLEKPSGLFEHNINEEK